jgi:hypothetical protein
MPACRIVAVTLPPAFDSAFIVNQIAATGVVNAAWVTDDEPLVVDVVFQIGSGAYRKGGLTGCSLRFSPTVVRQSGPSFQRKASRARCSIARPVFFAGQRLRFGYDVREAGEGERILAGAIERFTWRADGELVPLTEGSTRPIAETRTHAGIVTVKRYSFTMP